MIEAVVEKHLVKRVKELKGIPFKFVSPGITGVPDRLVLLPGGRIYFIELKAPGHKMRKRQEYIAKLIRNLGFTVLCLDTIEKVDDFIETLANY